MKTVIVDFTNLITSHEQRQEIAYLECQGQLSDDCLEFSKDDVKMKICFQDGVVIHSKTSLSSTTCHLVLDKTTQMTCLLEFGTLEFDVRLSKFVKTVSSFLIEYHLSEGGEEISFHHINIKYQEVA